MVAIIDNELLKECQHYFEKKDLSNALDCYDKALLMVDKSSDQSKYISFLKQILENSREESLKEREAIILRTLGRTHSVFGQHFESLKYHQEALKIQRKMGRKLDSAESLVLLAESLEFAERPEESINTYKDAAEMFQELGKLKKAKDLNKEITRLKDLSEKFINDDFYLKKFHINRS